MKKAIFIIPHFGKFPNYFQLFLNSCAGKKYVDFLIFTDDRTEYCYPSNVKVHYTTLNDIEKLINSQLGLESRLEQAYKLCDFRPAYGLIFKEHLKEYDYWGYCDTDLIFGDLDRYLEPVLEKDYDKLFFLGHCTLFKNNDENTKMFFEEIKGKKRWHEIFHSWESQHFDEAFEHGINYIYEQSSKKVYNENFSADIYTHGTKFYVVRMPAKGGIINIKKEGYVDRDGDTLFVYDNGKIFQYFMKDNQLKKREYMYIHLQKREMKVTIAPNSSLYKIIPNVFENLEYKNITPENFHLIRKYYFNFHKIKLIYSLKKKHFKIRKRRLFDKLKGSN
ncbi:DUF6625 family protein [Streptococcus hillyeri]|uniref:Uncharacterized protein n=1 Tax=Streptococcus hillyeri TaxID=2282420 RepID=A0A3L9DR40_9STRE|nr:DUF6625 family protein [Streptococcus hillyeri]RLY02427.1 hypothetical protein EAF07_07615 [Streptococcus hillyeri]